MRFFIAFALLLTTSFIYADSAKIAVIHHQDYPPYIWWDKQNKKLLGFRYSLTEKVLSELGIGIDQVIINTPNPYDISYLVNNLKSGKLSFGAMTQDVFENLDYVHVVETPIQNIQFKVFVPKGQTFVYRQWADLKNKRGLVQGSEDDPVAITNDFDLYAQRELDVRLMPSLDTMFLALENGEADYLVSIYRPALIRLRLIDKQNDIVALDPPVASVGVHWVIDKKSSLMARADEIEALLRQYREQGRLDLMMNDAMQLYINTARQ